MLVSLSRLLIIINSLAFFSYSCSEDEAPPPAAATCATDDTTQETQQTTDQEGAGQTAALIADETAQTGQATETDDDASDETTNATTDCTTQQIQQTQQPVQQQKQIIQQSTNTTPTNTAPPKPVALLAAVTTGKTGTDIKCSATVDADADGDSLTLNYVFSKGTTQLLSGAADTYTLVAGQDVVGDIIQCKVSASDGKATTESDAASFTVLNSEPTYSASLSAASTGQTGTDLTCSVSGVTDPDGDATTTSYVFSKGGISVQSGASGTYTLANGTDVNGDVITCQASVSDGHATVTSDMMSFTVVNTPPTISCTNLSQTLAPTTAITNITCTVGDADGESLVTTLEGDCPGLSLSNLVVSGNIPAFGCRSSVEVTDGNVSVGAQLELKSDYSGLAFDSLPYGKASFDDLAFGPQVNGLVIDSGKIYSWGRNESTGISVSSDDGSTWSTFTTADGLRSDDLYNVVINGSFIWAQAYSNSAFSTDGGSNWTESSVSHSTYASQAISNGDGSYTIYVPCGFSDGCTLKVSNDTGSTWSTVGSTQYTAGYMSVLDHDGDDDTSDHVIILAYSDDVYYSTDSGANWSNYTAAGSAWDVAVLYYSSNLVYLVPHNGGVDVSLDGGTTWATKTTTHGLDANVVTDIIIDGTTIYAAHKYYGGYSVSTDGGASWTAKTTNDDVYTMAISGSNLYYASGTDIYKSTDSGTTWTSITTYAEAPREPDLVQGNGNKLAASTTNSNVGYNLHYSADGGLSWTKKTTSDGLGSAFISDIYFEDNNTIYVGHYGSSTKKYGYSYSTDSATSFTHVDVAGEGLCSDSVYRIRANGSKIYIGTKDVGVCISTDGGSNWNSYGMGEGVAAVDIKDLSIANGYVFAATYAGISYSANDGSTWTTLTMSNGLATNSVAAIDVQENADGNIRIYAYGSSKFFMSDDTGKNWTTYGSSLYNASRIDARGNSIILSGGYYTHISGDGGTTWLTLNTSNSLDLGLPNDQDFGQAYLGDSQLFLGNDWASLAGSLY